MRIFLLALAVSFSICGSAQQTRDTVLSRCPVFITDTVSVNNFFIEGRSCTLKVYRVKGDLTIQIEQKDQFFTLFFHTSKLKSMSYRIEPGSGGRGEVEAAYSFKSGDQASFISVGKGTVDCAYDKEKKIWRIKVNGMISNMVERSVSYYRAKADFIIK